MPVTGSLGDVSWSDLLGYDPLQAEGRLAGDGRYVASQVAERLNITVPRLTYLTQSGQLPAPTGAMWGKKKTWTASDIEACQRVLPGIKDKRRK